MTDYRNHIAKARDAWFESVEGKSCLSGSTSGRYLRNRLERAFLAGYWAAETNCTTPLSAPRMCAGKDHK